MIRLYSRSCTDTFKEATLRTNVDNVYACPFFAARRFSSIFIVISPNHLFTTYQYILIWFLLASGDQRERLIHGQFSSQLCMLFMSLRISNGTFTLHFYCIFVFLSDILERLIRFSQLFVIRL